MQLFADRFLVSEALLRRSSAGRAEELPAIDLASGAEATLRIARAGNRPAQEAWVQACAAKFSAGLLLDFGFIGRDCRFEASSTSGLAPTASAVDIAHVLEWLDRSPASSSRVLEVSCVPDPREIRLRGFVPLSLGGLRSLSDRDVRFLRHRSLVVLAESHLPHDWSLALVELRRAGAADVHVLRKTAATPGHRAVSAAERRPAYGPAEGQRLVTIGRHAAAERALRAAIGGLGRRGDLLRAGNAEMTLGQLLLTRGRAGDARALFESASRRFEGLRSAAHAVEATLYRGLAETDLELLQDAEQTCRLAFAAATGLGDKTLSMRCSVALGRTLCWQRRHREALDLIEAIAPVGGAEAVASYWCLAARLRIESGDLPNARRAIDRLRVDTGSATPVVEAHVRRWEAAIQAALGDQEAVVHHAREGIRAARAAHLPLQSIKLRLVMVDGFLTTGDRSAARRAGARLKRIGRKQVPPLLAARVERTLARVEQGLDRPASTHSARARESAHHFQTFPSDAADEVKGLERLIASSHEYEDEAEALARATAVLRQHAGALGAGIFACATGEMRLLASCGAYDRVIARRAFDAGLAMGPEPTGGWVSAAIPIRYLGRFIGALSLRWTVEGPPNAARATAFGAAAAAACAPLVYVLQERHPGASTEAAGTELIGVGPAIAEVRRAVARAANAPFTVLIEGESGAGKELVARAIHRSGCRRDRPFFALNCAAMPEDLIDTELFGHARGAFTGAASERLGLFESADGGTLFLDEVGELSARAQAKVLRALQEGEVRRIGESVTRAFDTRLIAATNRSLRAEAAAGRFRQDLLYRLDVIRIQVPPLRQRVEDIPGLAARFWSEAAARIDSRAVLSKSAVSALTRYDWPGNVRELQNVLTALVVAAPRRGVVRDAALPSVIAHAVQPEAGESLEAARQEFEKRFVRAALARAAGHRGQTAAALGVSRQGLAKLMERLQLDA